MPTRYRSPAVVILVFLSTIAAAGCIVEDPPAVSTTPPIATKGCHVAGAPPAGTGVGKPSLAVAYGDRVARLEYDQAKNAYVETGAASGGSPGNALAYAGDSLFGVLDDAVVRFDDAFRPNPVATDGPYGAAASDGKTFYVAGQGRLDTVGPDARPGGSVTFREGARKTSHDVMVCATRAFLLDNVVQPIYVYVVDVSRADQPRVVAERRLLESTGHLRDQWAADGRWYVLHSAGSNTGVRESLLVLSPSTAERVDEFELYRAEYSVPGNTFRNASGTYVLSVAPSDPPWGLVQRDGRYWAAQLSVQDRTLRTARMVDLGISHEGAPFWSHMVIYGDALVAAAGPSVRIVDVSAAPRVVHAQELPESVTSLAIL